jgi:hypothetical protein
LRSSYKGGINMKEDIYKILSIYLTNGIISINSTTQLNQILRQHTNDMMYNDICEIRDELNVPERYPGHNDRGQFNRLHIIYMGLRGKIFNEEATADEIRFQDLLKEHYFDKRQEEPEEQRVNRISS